MGNIIKLCVWILDMVAAVTKFLVSIPAMAGTALISLATGFVALVENVGSIAHNISLFYQTAKSASDNLFTTLSESPLFSFFGSLCALDKLGDCIMSFLAIGMVLVFLALFEVFFHGLIVAVPFLIYKSVAKIVKTVTAGHVDAT